MPRSRSTRISSRRISRTSIRKTSASSIRDRLALVVGLLAAASGPATAQGLRLEGRVLRADSTPLPDAWVVLHRVTMDGGGPLDSLRASRTGTFQFRVPSADTTALYMASTTYLGLTYFSEVRTGRDAGGPLDPLVVYDTSSTGPAIVVAQRHLVVRGGQGSGRRSVLELVGLANDGNRTRIAGEPPRPTWVGRIAADAENFEVGQGDVSAEAVRLVGDSVIVTAPMPPGVKQLVFSYDVPGARELRFPIDQPADRLLVLLADTAAVVESGPVMRRGTEVFDDTPFAVFSGSATSGTGDLVFRFSRRAFSAVTGTALIAAVAALLLLLAVPLLARRSPAVVRAAPPETPEALARAIAALDAEHERAQGTGADTTAYRQRREELKHRLSELLAKRREGA